MPIDVVEQRARFASEAMLTLAKQVKEYCASFPGRIAGLREPERARKLRQFELNANALCGMLHTLMEKAAEVDAMRVLNREQYEAAVAEVERVLDGYRLKNVALN